jgi:hypothetical protein
MDQRQSRRAGPNTKEDEMSLMMLRQKVKDGPPVIEQLDVVGSYNLFGAEPERSAVESADS